MTGATSTNKADFSRIYNEPDPTAFYLTLSELEYEIPRHGADLIARVLAARADRAGTRPTVLDVCCSYGVGAILLRTDLDLAELFAHYRTAAAGGLRGDPLARADAALLRQRIRPGAPRLLGLDAAPNATRYAVAIGALDDAFSEDLEAQEPSDRLVRALAGVDLVTTVGGVGYVTGRTYARLLDAMPHRPWVAAFCLRTYDYQPIVDAFAARGLVTERAAGCFPQRRFVDDAEREWAVSAVSTRGLDPGGREADGRYHAEFFLSRPADDAARLPLDSLLAGVP